MTRWMSDDPLGYSWVSGFHRSCFSLATRPTCAHSIQGLITNPLQEIKDMRRKLWSTCTEGLCGPTQTPVILLKEVWGYNAAVTTHTLETHIYRLRQKIESDPTRAVLLVTEAGGYKLVP